MRIIYKLTAVCALAFLLTGYAFAGQLKIGVIDIREVATKSSDVAKAKTALMVKFKTRQQEIIKLQEQLKADVDKFKRDAAVMTKKDKQAQQQKILKERQEYALKGQAYEQDLAKEQQKMTNDFLKRVKNVVDKIAKKEKYDLILQKENVPYSSEALDITAAVIKQL